MKSLNHSMYFIFIVLIISFSTSSCSDNLSSSILQDDVKLVYSTQNGQDVFQKGSYCGDKIKVYYDGKVEKYSRYYESEDVLVQTSQISLSDIDDLSNLFVEYNFFAYPDILPSTNNIHWPSSGCFISFSQAIKQETKEVSVIGFEQSQYYPSGFYEFLAKLKQKLNSFIN